MSENTNPKPSPNNNSFVEIDLTKLFAYFLPRVWIILLTIFIFAAGAFSYARFFVTPMYSSSIMMYVNNSSISLGSANLSIDNGSITAAKSLVSTYMIILNTPETAEEVIAKTGVNYSFKKLLGMLSTSSVDNTEIFRITVRSTDPEEAAMLSNAFADVLPDRISDIVNGSSVKVVSKGRIATSKVSPSYSRYTAIGAVAGFALSCALLLLNFLRDTLIRDEKEVGEKYHIPLLVSISSLTKKEKRNRYGKYYGKYKSYYSSSYNKEEKQKVAANTQNQRRSTVCENLSFDNAEAYKLLRTNIMFALPNTDSRIISITSSVRAEGKSTTAINLSYTLAQTGKRVLLIDGDMRLPSIGKTLSISPAPGLSNVLAGLSTIEEAIRPSLILDSWKVLPAGKIPPNPAELLGSEPMRQLLEKLRTMFDFVILDCPPINIVSDALASIDYVDGCIITVRQNFTDRRVLAETMEKCSVAKSKILGYVMNDADPYGDTYSQYRKKYKYYRNYKSDKRYGYGSYSYGETSSSKTGAVKSDD